MSRDHQIPLIFSEEQYARLLEIKEHSPANTIGEVISMALHRYEAMLLAAGELRPLGSKSVTWSSKDTRSPVNADEVGDFVSRSGVLVDHSVDKIMRCINVLYDLYGHPWDTLSHNRVLGLRPSYIRVIQWNGEETTDWRTDRVTVYLNPDNLTIDYITQEQRVGNRDLPTRYMSHG